MSKRNHRVLRAIPEPYENVHALMLTVMATKEVAETITGQRGNLLDCAVTWGDLVDLGLITKDQVPNA